MKRLRFGSSQSSCPAPVLNSATNPSPQCSQHILVAIYFAYLLFALELTSSILPALVHLSFISSLGCLLQVRAFRPPKNTRGSVVWGHVMVFFPCPHFQWEALCLASGSLMSLGKGTCGRCLCVHTSSFCLASSVCVSLCCHVCRLISFTNASMVVGWRIIGMGTSFSIMLSIRTRWSMRQSFNDRNWVCVYPR